MKVRIAFAALAAVAATVLLAGGVLSQDGDGGKKGPSEEEKMMEAWMKAGTPGEGHKRLDPFVGSWTFTGKFWMNPAAPPTVTTGTATVEWILDGRWLQETVESEIQGRTFKGFGLSGYDNAKQKYVTTWADSMSTTLHVGSGTVDESGKTFTYEVTSTDPLSGNTVTSRHVGRLVSEDEHVYEMFMTGPDGKEFKKGELAYQRAK